MKKLLILGLLLAFDASALTGEKHVIREINPTIDVTSYTIGDQIDTAKKIGAATNSSGAFGQIHEVTVIDNSGKASPIRVWLFENKPVLSSLNNQPFNITDDAASTAKLLGVVNITANSYIRDGRNERAVGSVLTLDKIMKAGNGTTEMWAVLEAASTVTYTSANDLSVRFGIQQD